MSQKQTHRINVIKPEFSLVEIADTLSSAAGADIWFDADAPGDEDAAAQIEQAQGAMERVAQWLKDSDPTDAPDLRPASPLGNRVLITVSGGVADYVCDPGLDVEIFDRDNYDADPDETDGVPSHFADLAGPSEIPVRDPVPLSADAAKTLATVQLQRALAAATEAGLFDEMAANLHPDIINRFCDAVSDEFAARTHTEEDTPPPDAPGA